MHRPIARKSIACTAILLAAVTGSCSRGGSHDADRAAALFNAGVGLMVEAKFAEAQAKFAEALVLDQGEPAYGLALGQAFMNQAKNDSARIFLERAASGNLPEARYSLAFLDLREGRYEEALDALRGVCGDDTARCGYPEVAYLIGTAWSRLDDGAKAIAWFEKSAALDPQLISAHYALAQGWRRAGNAAAADSATVRFERLRDGGGTSIDLNGDVGTGTQGGLSAMVIPAWGGSVRPENGKDRAGKVTANRVRFRFPRIVPGDRWRAIRLADVNGDGRIDLVLAAETGVRLWLNGGEGVFADATEASGLAATADAGDGITDIAIADFSRDGAVDIVVARWGATTVWRWAPGGEFAPDDARLPGARQVLPVDVDQDGWLDLVLVPSGEHHGPGPVLGLAYWHNGGDGTLSDATARAGVDEARLAPLLADREGIAAVAFADHDRDHDVDLLLTFRRGAPVWLENAHNGTFLGHDGRPLVAPVPVPGAMAEDALVAAIGDAEPNGWFDVVMAGDAEVATIATTGFRTAEVAKPVSLNDGRGDSTQFPARGLRLVDYDCDGDEDLLMIRPGGRLTFRENPGDGRAWISSRELADRIAAYAPDSGVVDFAAGDIDGDGRLDLIILPDAGTPIALRFGGAGKLLSVRLAGGRSVPDGRGAAVDVACGRRWMRRLVTGAEPLYVGLGADTVDVLRTTWTSGIRQAVFPPIGAATVVKEKPGETSSCPFVWTWDGARFAFVADAIGGGVIGVVVDPPDTYHQPDPDEYLRVPDGALVPRDGRLDIRITETLSEATWVDEARLLSVSAEPGVEVFPDERMPMAGSGPAFAIHRVRNARPIAGARDGDGHDLTALLRDRDGRYAEPGRELPYKGYGFPHDLVIDLGPIPPRGPVALVLDGWTSFWSSSSIAEAARDGVTLIPPSVEVPDGHGGWTTVVADLGLPAGKPKTIVADLTGKLPPGMRTVRIRTNMLIYWDRVRLTTEPLDAAPIAVTELPLRSAALRYRGYQRPTMDGPLPQYRYEAISHDRPWPVLPGSYTRYGDVRDLLTAADDRQVVMNHGDEIALSFAAPEGNRRPTYLVYLRGYMKEVVPRDPLLSRLEPLPFAAMGRYPYTAPIAYPADDAHLRYQREYNTRVIGRD